MLQLENCKTKHYNVVRTFRVFLARAASDRISRSERSSFTRESRELRESEIYGRA